MSNQLLQQILKEVKTLNTRVEKMDMKIDSLDTKVDSLETKVDNLETKVNSLDAKVSSLETQVNNIKSDLQEFRQETNIHFQILKSAQEGLQKQINHRFKETNAKLTNLEDKLVTEIEDLKLDVEFTYVITTRNELALKKLRTKG